MKLTGSDAGSIGSISSERCSAWGSHNPSADRAASTSFAEALGKKPHFEQAETPAAFVALHTLHTHLYFGLMSNVQAIGQRAFALSLPSELLAVWGARAIPLSVFDVAMSR